MYVGKLKGVYLITVWFFSSFQTFYFVFFSTACFGLYFIGLVASYCVVKAKKIFFFT